MTGKLYFDMDTCNLALLLFLLSNLEETFPWSMHLLVHRPKYQNCDFIGELMGVKPYRPQMHRTELSFLILYWLYIRLYCWTDEFSAFLIFFLLWGTTEAEKDKRG